MAIEDEMDIGDAGQRGLGHAGDADQMFRRDQSLGRVEMKRGFRAIDQKPVIGTDLHVTLGQPVPQGALPDQDRAQMRRAVQIGSGQGSVADPANGLDTVVAGDDPVADAQFFD